MHTHSNAVHQTYTEELFLPKSRAKYAMHSSEQPISTESSSFCLFCLNFFRILFSSKHQSKRDEITVINLHQCNHNNILTFKMSTVHANAMKSYHRSFIWLYGQVSRNSLLTVKSHGAPDNNSPNWVG